MNTQVQVPTSTDPSLNCPLKIARSSIPERRVLQRKERKGKGVKLSSKRAMSYNFAMFFADASAMERGSMCSQASRSSRPWFCKDDRTPPEVVVVVVYREELCRSSFIMLANLNVSGRGYHAKIA